MLSIYNTVAASDRVSILRNDLESESRTVDRAFAINPFREDLIVALISFKFSYFLQRPQKLGVVTVSIDR